MQKQITISSYMPLEFLLRTQSRLMPYPRLLHPSYRKQLELRLQPGGADFRDAVAKEVASVEERHSHREAELQEKLAEGRKQYTALEDEFRMALTIEAARFSEVC